MSADPRPENPLLTAALGYARRGWAVFPCRPADKVPYPRPDTDAEGNEIKSSGGLKKASTDEAQIRAWWREHPHALIGMRTGKASGVFVVDVDAGPDKSSGEIFDLDELMANLEAITGPLPETLTAATPRGGRHIYFQTPEVPPIGNRTNIIEKIDSRGDDGFVVLPPSVATGPFGGAYSWVNDAPIAAAPAEVVHFVKHHRKARPAIGERPVREHGPGPSIAVSEAVRAHGYKVLDREVARVIAAPQGSRNDELNKAAFTLGGLVGAGALSRSVVQAALEDAARQCGTWATNGERATLATIASGLAAGEREPIDVSEVERRALRPSGGSARPRGGPAAALPARDTSPPSAAAASSPSAASPLPAPRGGGEDFPPSQTGRFGPANDPGKGGEPDPDELNRFGAFRPHTDLGNAERFYARFGHRFMWCVAHGWFAWNGRYWELFMADEKEALPPYVAQAVYDTVRAIGDEADWLREAGEVYREDNWYDEDEVLKGNAAPDPDDPDPYVDIKKELRKSDKLRSWGRASESASRIGCIARLARPWITVDDSSLDADPYKINVANGTLTVSRVGNGCNDAFFEFGPHDPADRITKVSPAAYDPEASCPTYDDFFAKVQPDPKMRKFLHAWGGYSLLGDASEQKLVFHYGTGRNGKGTMVNAHAYVAGGYATTVSIETFLDSGMAKKGSDASPDLAKLPGVRMLMASEPEKGAKLAEGLIKSVTGGDEITARHLNRGFFTYLPVFKLTVQGNYKPTIGGTDDGIWDRLQLVPWEVYIPDSERDPELKAKLRAEASGILNRLIEGIRTWMETGLGAPSSVVDATAEYRAASDPLRAFIGSCVEPSPGTRVQSSKLYAVYCAWAKHEGEKVWSQTGFSKAMLDRGYQKKQSDTIQWLDIRLLKLEGDFAPPDDDGWRGGGGYER